MSNTITWVAMLWCLVPILVVAAIFRLWRSRIDEVLIASARMFVQLLAVGYLLVFIFAQPSVWMTLLVLSVMILVATWIAIRPVKQHPGLLLPGFIALFISVFAHLLLSIGLIIDVDTWYQPNVIIPLAGMYFANTMNSISLSAERFYAEIAHGEDPRTARNNAYGAAMIPQINGLLAVGVVALPGMMTGQILSGVSPLIAVRYQILIMTMLLGTTGVGAAIMLWQLARKQTNNSLE